MSKTRNYVVVYNLYQFFYQGGIEKEREDRSEVKAFSAEDAYFQVKIQLDRSYAGSSYGNGQPCTGYSIIRIEPIENIE